VNCDEFVELVTAFLDDALDQMAEDRFVGHLSTCDGCMRYLDQFRSTVHTLGELPKPNISPTTRDALLTAFRTSHD
jgi:hypothetical protein